MIDLPKAVADVAKDTVNVVTCPATETVKILGAPVKELSKGLKEIFDEREGD